MRIPDVYPKLDVRLNKSVKVLIFYDEEGWAWWHRAHQIKKNLSKFIQVEIKKLSETFDHHQFDLILLFDAQLLIHFPFLPRNKIILGSSCPKLTPEAIQIYQQEKCAAVLVNNLESFEKYQDKATIFCCQNGVDTDLFYPAVIPKENWTACWVGNSKSIGNKGLELIIAACKNADVPLIICDKSDQTGKVLTQEQVRDQIYHQSRIYICASEFEGTPNPMLEAMACGLGVVSTAVGNAPEIIKAGVNGFLSLRTEQALTEAILKIKKLNPIELGMNSRRIVEEKWTWKTQIKKYEKVFVNLSSTQKNVENKKNYRHIIWIDSQPIPEERERQKQISAFRNFYSDSNITFCCDSTSQYFYQNLGFQHGLIYFDSQRIQNDLEYRELILSQLQQLKPDLAINMTASEDIIADYLLMGIETAEKITSENYFFKSRPDLREGLKPFVSKLINTRTPSLNNSEHIWKILLNLGIQKINSKKILLVVHMFPPHWYAGVEVYTYHLAKNLMAQGLNVSVFYPLLDRSKKNPELVSSTFDGIPVFTLLNDDADTFYFNISSPKLDPVFSNFLNQHQFDLIHFQHTVCLSFKMIEIAKVRNIPICLTLHDFWFMCQRIHFYIEAKNEMCSGPDTPQKCTRCVTQAEWELLPLGHKEFVLNHFTNRENYVKSALKMFDMIISPTQYVAKKFIDFGFCTEKQIIISPLGLNVDASQISFKKETKNQIRFGFLGSIHPLKNVNLLADAFKKISGNATLSFFGGGEKENIESLVQRIRGDHRISYFGKFAPIDLNSILGKLDVVVVCSVTENYPLVLREALNAKIPVIASRVGGIPEIVKDGVTGILFNPNRPQELIDAMQLLIDEPDRIERMKNAIEPVKSIQQDAEEWITRYQTLVS